jgi:hypothetical protein
VGAAAKRSHCGVVCSPAQRLRLPNDPSGANAKADVIAVKEAFLQLRQRSDSGLSIRFAESGTGSPRAMLLSPCASPTDLSAVCQH